ncbi:transmembrane protein 17 isoform X3 [Dermochelys coriacea]|uniref:transmembrane protein 17 isoform X3 n=1 Tax=Dermochelys coriacea TaxID=27794 RepID=UPI001CA95185|nr:transmembrane protein 17 isoform X3 [Dermochelys coriacea]
MLTSLITRQGGVVPPCFIGSGRLASLPPGCHSSGLDAPRAASMALPDPLRRRLGSLSRTVFSDSNRTGPERRGSGGSLDNEIVSSLPLQMSLYFNLYFFPFWWVSSVVMLQLKYPVLPDYYKFILVTAIVLVSLIEAIRLYLGYMGNLQEKVIAAFLALKRMVNQLAVHFSLKEFDQLDDHPRSDYLAWEKKRVQAPWRVEGQSSPYIEGMESMFLFRSLWQKPNW